jgi:predicted ester cyclase
LVLPLILSPENKISVLNCSYSEIYYLINNLLKLNLKIMKTLIAGAIIAAFFFCACKSKSDADDSGNYAAIFSQKIKQVALNADKALGRGEVDSAYKDCTADFTEYGNGESKTTRNLDSTKAYMKLFVRAFPDFKGENLHAYADSNTVVVTGDWSGTFKNQFRDLPPTGKSFKLPEADIFIFNKDGKITAHKSVQSETAYLYQLGIPLPASN